MWPRLLSIPDCMGLTAHNLTKMAQTIPLKLRNTCFRKDSYICVYAHKCEVPDEETQLFLRTLQEWMLGTNPVTVALQAEVSHAEYMTADSLRATKFFVEEHGEGTFAGPYAVRTRNGCSAVIWRFPQAIPFLVHDQAGPLTSIDEV